jgi:hypothetical protein
MADEEKPWLKKAPIIEPLNPFEGKDNATTGEPAPSIGRGLGLAARDAIEGVVGPAYDLIGRGINATGILPAIGIGPINALSHNLTTLGLPKPETQTERMISAVQQPVIGTVGPLAAGRAMSNAATPVVRTVGEALKSQPGVQAVSAGVGGAVGEATGSPELGIAASMLTPLGIAGLSRARRGVEGAAFDVSKEDAELGRLAKDKYNIPVGAPDLTDNSLLRIGADQMGKLPFSGARPADVAKRKAWQGAIAKEIGDPDATSFTHDVMQKSATRIGAVFDDVATRTVIPPAETTALVQDLDSVLHRATRLLQPGEIAPLKAQIDDLKAFIAQNNGAIDGAAYQRLTNSKSLLSKLERQNTNTGDLASDVRDALDDAFARSARPEDHAALQQARYQYRVMRTVDQLAAGSRTGDITPDAFMQKVLAASRKFDAPLGGMAYTGGGNVGELARIGKLMRAAPQTGTADRALINAATFGGPLAAPSVYTAVGIPAALAANRLAGGYLRSGGLANRLIEGATGSAPPFQNELMRSLQTSGVTGIEAEMQKLRR